MSTDAILLSFLTVLVVGLKLKDIYESFWWADLIMIAIFLISGLSIGISIWKEYFSRTGKTKRKQIKEIREIPNSISTHQGDSVLMGLEQDLGLPIYLPDAIRKRHVHILGATGSGKTESVILNFLRQDISRGIGSIILDAKGDASFLAALTKWVPESKLRVFDLGSENSLTYNPLQAGSALESAQRLFSSLTWSEEYYKSKAFSAIQRVFQNHRRKTEQNPTLSELSSYFESPENFTEITMSDQYSKKVVEKDYTELSGLCDQIKTLSTGYLNQILSGNAESGIRLEDVKSGEVLYFRLQSLMSPQLVSIVGKLIINHINYLAGSSHRNSNSGTGLTPIYLDEFASFACPEFADLISKARSAGFALHFSHQSIGDLTEVSPGFLNRITDNSGTKIVLRINDPDSAEYFSRTFGTKIYQKITQRITNVKEIEKAEVVGEGTQREAHQFRASPDLLKTLPTGMGAVLIAHGADTSSGGSHVFKIRFPMLT